SAGMVKGTVKDDKGEAVEGAKIVIEFAEGVNRKQETKTNKKGEFVQIGLQPGAYKVTAEKEGVGAKMMETRVRLGATAELNFILAKGTAGPTKEEIAKNTELKKAFEEGVAASKAGNTDEAIAKFKQASELSPTCGDCFYNQGVILWNAGKIPEAKKQFEAALKVDPNHAESHFQLGMALLNENSLAQAVPEFETYLKLAPEGPNAAVAKSVLSSIKK